MGWEMLTDDLWCSHTLLFTVMVRSQFTRISNCISKMVRHIAMKLGGVMGQGWGMLTND